MSKPLRVLLDARMLVGRFSGVARVVTELIDSLAKHPGLEVAALCGRDTYPAWAGRTDFRIIPSTFGRGDRTALRRLWWEETHLPRLIRAANVDLFHATWNRGTPARCPVPSVLTIHDLIPWDAPTSGLAGMLERSCYRHAVRSAARRAALITTVSEHTRQTVLAALDPPADRVVVVPNGVRDIALAPPCFRFPVPRPSPDPYVLYVGGHESRKNLAAVFAAMSVYWHRFSDPLDLHVTGSAASLSLDARTAYDRLPHKGRVHFLGSLTDQEVGAEYASASLLLLLSTAEGFGLPVLEAMANGCPVIAADRAALPEVTADAGILVDPDKPAQVAEAMRRVVSDPLRRQEMIARGRRRAASSTWQDVAVRMRDVYQQAANSGVRGSVQPTVRDPTTSPEPAWAAVAHEPAGSPP